MPRKPRKEPGIFERSPGKWYIRYYDEHGRDVKKACGPKSAAQAQLQYWKEEIRKRKSPVEVSDKERAQGKLTLGDLLDRYLPEFEEQASYRDKKRYAKIWKAEFGKRLAREIVPGEIILWQKEQKLLGMTPATIQRYTAFLRRIYNLGIRDKILNDNPIGLGRVPAQKESGTRKRVILPAEERAILPELVPLDRAAFVISLYGGLRQGEVLRLSRSDIDLERRYAKLRKTKAGKEQGVPLNSALVEAVSFVMSQHDHELLFPSERDPKRPMSGSRLTDRLKAVCEKLGLEGIIWQSTRHTFLTRLADRGHGINTVRDLGRHSTVKVTSGYMHTNQAANLQAVESLCEGRGDVLFPSAPSNRGHLRALP